MKYAFLWPLVLWNIGHDLEVQEQEWAGQFPSISSTEDRVAEKMMTPWADSMNSTVRADTPRFVRTYYYFPFSYK